MAGKKLSGILVFVFLLMSATVMNAQVDQTEKDKSKQSGMGGGMISSSMQECMNQIASDSQLRKEMMTKMMDQVKGDTSSMRQMCNEMMKDPEMHKMMMKMMHQEGSSGMGGMMKDKMQDSVKIHHPEMP